MVDEYGRDFPVGGPCDLVVESVKFKGGIFDFRKLVGWGVCILHELFGRWRDGLFL